MKRPEPSVEQMVRKFGAYLSTRRLTPGYVYVLLRHIKAGLSDPVGYTSGLTNAKLFRDSRQAWIHWSNWTGSEDLSRALARLVAPRALPPRPRVPPAPAQIREYAEGAAGLPVPWGPVLWLVFLSGLRVREVCRIQRLEAQDALQRPEIIVRAKGAGGLARRTWVAGGLVRMALAPLLRVPWREVWSLLSTSPDAAAGRIRAKCPEGFLPHDFRHGIARVMRSIRTQDGRRLIPTEVISAVLGHDLRAVQGTTAIYAPPSVAEIEEAHALLGAYLWPDGIPAPAGSWLGGRGFPVDMGRRPAPGAPKPGSGQDGTSTGQGGADVG